AVVTGLASTEVTWSSSDGNIDISSGLYTAPASVGAATSATITATSVADPAQTASVTLWVNPVNATVDFTHLLSPLDPYTFGIDVTGYPGSGPNITNDTIQQQMMQGMAAMMRMDLKYTTPGDPTSPLKCGGSGCNTSIAGDDWITSIMAIGAEPVVLVGGISAATYLTDAANLVKHFNIGSDGVTPDPTLPNYVKYWIIGNENDLGVNGGYSGSSYGAIFNQAYLAMKEVDPNIKIGGPATGGPYSGGGMSSTLPITKPGSYDSASLSQWIDDFLTTSGQYVDFLDFHKYDLSSSTWNDSTSTSPSTGRLITGSGSASSNSGSGNTYKYQIRPAQIMFEVAHNPQSASRAAQIGVQIGEWNISNASISGSPEIRLPFDFFNTLYSASALGEMTTVGARSLMFGDKSGPLGMLEDGTTHTNAAMPTWVPPALNDPMPIYYGYGMYTGMGLFRHYGTEAVATTTSIGAAPNGLDVFASANDKNIVVVNKNNIAETVTLSLTGFTDGTADVWQKAAEGGVIGSNDAQGPLYDPAPAQSLGTLNVTNGGLSILVPPYSVTTLVLNAPVSVVASPGVVSLNASQTQQFTATVTGDSTNSVTWAVSCASGGTGCGTIDSTGLYTAPESIPMLTFNAIVNPGTPTVPDSAIITTTSTADNTASTFVSVKLIP
ncbi:MAG: hypothetical protein FWD64_12610, partial [Acidobacteriaceae bacterium]|nr:hypothetical protein [Acidobacteriaceae bacterium]